MNGAVGRIVQRIVGMELKYEGEHVPILALHIMVIHVRETSLSRVIAMNIIVLVSHPMLVGRGGPTVGVQGGVHPT